jgi:UDP-2,4-diacetamido-2,4,6-trideoxy-beta-L-altropyranose hydrolase
MTPGLLLIRADASVATGTGHVMRCLALAQAWQDRGGHSIFAMAATTKDLESRLLREGLQIERLVVDPGTEEDATQTVRMAHERRTDWIVVDGYQFGASYQSAIKRSPGKLLFVDDNGHAEHYYCDLVLNQNVHASEDLYARRESYTRLLLGTRYAMLRREFRVGSEWKRTIREAGTRILIVGGGSDPHNLTQRIIEALEAVQEFRLDAVAIIGGSNPHRSAIENAAACSRHSIRLEVDAKDMPGRMAWADLAISAAGSICWEFCALALPALIIPIASNQEGAASSLERLGAAKLHCGGAGFSPPELAREAVSLMKSPSQRRRLSQHALALVDAGGAARVAEVLCRRTAGNMEEP